MGSTAGQWRLPNVLELRSLVDEQQASQATWLKSQGFSNVYSGSYWSSSTFYSNDTLAWHIDMYDGSVSFGIYKTFSFYVWPVRGGQ